MGDERYWMTAQQEGLEPARELPSVAALRGKVMRLVPPTPENPWGDYDPPGGFQVGDFVGLAYSDHKEYIFDNPVGFVESVDMYCYEHDEGDKFCTDPECSDLRTAVEVSVCATFPADRVALRARPEPEQRHGGS